ncbi:MAG: exodeoxyribonuclease III [Sphingomonadales bacterium]
MTVRIATWNVNSVRTRLDHVRRFVAEVKPDVLCLQEIKVCDADFPLAAFRDMGFDHWALAGQKSYHGVAIFSTLPLEGRPRHDWGGNGEARHQCVALPGGVELHNLYVPAGGDVPDPRENPKFAAKLDFFDNMSATFSALKEKEPRRRMILLGDLNVAPLECDVWSHKQLLKVVSHTPIEVEKMTAFQRSFDWIDAVRSIIPAPEPVYSWWSYRSRDWRVNNRGRRLDHVWVSPTLGPGVRGVALHDHTRDWPRPSDHIPITLDLSIG